MNLLVLSVGFGLVTASVLALSAVGLTLQFGVTNYINFAYGEYLTLGAYLAWMANRNLHWSIWLGLVAATLLVGVFAVVVNRLLLRPFARRRVHLLTMLIVTLGLSLMFQNGILATWGSSFRRYSARSSTPLHLGPLLLTSNQLLIIGIALIAMLAIHAMLTFTKMGKAMRAMSDDADLARVCGIDTDRVTDWTWFVSGLLAGLAGTVLAVNVGSFTPTFGSTFLFVIFAAVILGGIGRPYGAMAGALIIGLVTEMAASLTNSAYKDAWAFIILVLTLLLRPQGVFTTQGKV